MESEVEVDLRKRDRFSTKYLTGRKNERGNNLLSCSTKFENIVEFVTFTRVFAKVEFTNLNFTKKVRILFVES